jgi:hypothetical protein
MRRTHGSTIRCLHPAAHKTLRAGQSSRCLGHPADTPVVRICREVARRRRCTAVICREAQAADETWQIAHSLLESNLKFAGTWRGSRNFSSILDTLVELSSLCLQDSGAIQCRRALCDEGLDYFRDVLHLVIRAGTRCLVRTQTFPKSGFANSLVRILRFFPI